MDVFELELLQIKDILMKSTINKQLLKDEILKSPLLDLIKQNITVGDEVIMLQLSGSFAANTATEGSDVDISALTTKSWDLVPTITGKFQDRSLHWWICPFDFFFKAYIEPRFLTLFWTGSYYMSFEEENIIYINPKYIKFIEFLRANYSYQKQFCIHQLVDHFKVQTDIWRVYENFPFNKTYAPLIDFYYEKNNLDRNTDLIKKAKQTVRGKTKLTSEEQAEIRKALLWTVDYTNNQPYNYKLAGLEWQVEADKILNECKKS